MRFLSVDAVFFNIFLRGFILSNPQTRLLSRLEQADLTEALLEKY